MKILIALDGSPFSDVALNEVMNRPWPKGSEFLVLTAYETPFAVTPDIWTLPTHYFEQLESSVRLRADSVVDVAVTKLRAALPSDCLIKGRCVTGSAKMVILDEAETWKADLIVVGSHGYPAWERLLLGSVSQAIVSHARCSVEIARGRTGSGFTVN